MAKDSPKKPAVRGPGGAARARGTTGRSAPPPTGDSGRARLERISAPFLVRLSRTPKWLLIIGLGLLLFLGLIQTGPLRWLGAALLGLVAVFFTWLLAVAWPALPTNGRMLRLLVVAALTALAVLKALGRM